MPRSWWSISPSTRLKAPQPARSDPTHARQGRAACPSRQARHSAVVPTATKIQVAAWKRPSASVLASSPATVVAGLPLVDVSMWCHWRIWCSRIPSTKPPRPMPRRKPGARGMGGGLPRGPGPDSDLVALQELAADDHALDLRGALADQQQRRVAVEPLDLVLLRVAVAAVDAEGVLDDLLAGLGGEELRHAGLEVRALARVLHPGGLEREQARRLDLGGHVGELELDGLVLGDRLAERRALLRVAQRQLERPLRDADAAGGDVHAADLERVHHLREALVEAGVLAAEDHVGRAAVAVEHQLRRLDALVAHLLDLRWDVEPGVVARVLGGAGLLLADEAGH